MLCVMRRHLEVEEARPGASRVAAGVAPAFLIGVAVRSVKPRDEDGPKNIHDAIDLRDQ